MAVGEYEPRTRIQIQVSMFFSRSFESISHAHRKFSSHKHHRNDIECHFSRPRCAVCRFNELSDETTIFHSLVFPCAADSEKRLDGTDVRRMLYNYTVNKTEHFMSHRNDCCDCCWFIQHDASHPGTASKHQLWCIVAFHFCCQFVGFFLLIAVSCSEYKTAQ